ncbi:hypothetical protein JAAARDRAFT_209615 [Jaapia argillacea MUCL 33604]|uniref:F-box domain-containing protein n=1 Tax=Jaapia argillacea MUCL 33604 TaxID=933084 RepID=A0A067PU16_9AGAM|nr:hypothetical protein JAAARDRAFT_209615 [Jaapia argillacea MUCL 33604]
MLTTDEPLRVDEVAQTILQNSLLPVWRIPAETLVDIFLHLSDDEGIENIETKPWKSWVKVTHVCHYWREVALDNPLLWTHLPITLPKWTLRMLSLSKQAPLHIDCFPQHPTHFQALLRALEHMERIEYLAIYVGFGSDELSKLSLITPAPRLKCLRLLHGDCFVVRRLPDDLFSGQTPCLRAIALVGLCLDWASPIFSNLVEIDISYSNIRMHLYRNRALPSAEDMARILRNCPHLQSLQLIESLPRPTAPGLPILPPIPLPNLRRLVVEGPAPDCASFVKQITYPPTIALRLGCSECTFDNILGVLPIMCSYWGSKGGIQRPGLYLFTGWEGVQDTLVAVDRFPTLVDGTIPAGLEDPTGISLSGDDLLPSPRPSRALAEILHTMDCGPLRAIRMRGDKAIESNDWIVALRCAVNVHTIHVDGPTNMFGLVDALQQLTEPTENSTLGNFALFPNLHRIILEGIDFDTCSADSTALDEALLGMFICRHESKQSLELHVRRCHHVHRIVWETEDHVSKVFWDGRDDNEREEEREEREGDDDG